MIRLLHGDCREVMATLDSASVDACVTDPPYGLGFMGKQWDAPGSFVERRPDRSVRFDKVGGNHNPTCSADASRTRAVEGRKLQAFCGEWADEVFRVLKPGAHLAAFGGTRTFHRVAVAIEDAGFEIRDTLCWLYGQGFPKSHNQPGGWGTALKPAWEPIILARKPLIGTVAGNMAAHGTGALNIDGCRVEGQASPFGRGTGRHGGQFGGGGQASHSRGAWVPTAEGRWPANVAHDGSDEVLEAFARFGEKTTNPKTQSGYSRAGMHGGGIVNDGGATYAGDSGTAARFFYEGKATKEERGEGNNHPTVKPLALMRWLCRLITPVGGTVLDPFLGSGSTALAADQEGFSCIGIEQSAEYLEIARRRIAGDAPLFSIAV